MKKTSVFILTVSFSFALLAQYEQKTGVWTDISIEKKISEKWTLGAESDIRTFGENDTYFVGEIDRWTLSVNAGYALFKPLKLGVTYMLMNKLDMEYDNYQWRHRMLLTASGTQKWSNFSFSLRERLQITVKDHSKRIKPDGTYARYSVNPDLVWRNRLLINYDIPRCRITPAVSLETFYSLNNPDGNQFDELRYILSFAYEINTCNSFELYGAYNHYPHIAPEIQNSVYIFGISYKIKI